jgi:hypothetical protein
MLTWVGLLMAIVPSLGTPHGVVDHVSNHKIGRTEKAPEETAKLAEQALWFAPRG